MKPLRYSSSSLLPFGDRPGRERLARDRLTGLEHVRFLGDQRLDVDDGVDDVVGAAEREVLVGFRIGRVLDDLAHLAAFLLDHRLELGQTPEQRAAGLHAAGLAVQVLDRLDARVGLALDVVVRRVGDRAGEVERLLALLGDDRRRDRHVVLAGADAGRAVRSRAGFPA
jgi:hypothetical protein